VDCDWNNARRGLYVPLYGTLCDGTLFQFFMFDGNNKPYLFSRGTLRGDPPVVRRGFQLDDHTAAETPRPFIRTLRPICELIFDLLLTSYISSLNAYHNRSIGTGQKVRKPRKSTAEWEQALALASDALEKFRVAETKRQNQLCEDANAFVRDAMELLKRRYIDVQHASSLTTCNAI